MSCSLVSIIMAGGLGKRMSSTCAKVLHEINGKPMLHYVIQNAVSVGSQHIFIVVGKYKPDIVASVVSQFSSDVVDRIVFVSQNEIVRDGNVCSLGTGDAVRSCLSHFSHYNCDENTNVLILSGDVPVIDPLHLTTLSKMKNGMMVAEVEDPTGYGRVFLNDNGELSSIVEHSLCDPTQLQCKLVNAGIYCLSIRLLKNTIPHIHINERKKEFLLTDFYQYTDLPITCYCVPIVPKNVNTLTDLHSI
jgi:bifunctional N-acetylglucosamine-1-phosphate-uridyltransferase/glucosamine-1-phosphate-acetyltransferase GlmU-like protein